MSQSDYARLLKEQIKVLEKLDQYKENLPHLFGFKWYSWARQFFESTNRYNFLCAANQISKSSTAIRKSIDWATNIQKWKTLWPHRQPRQFWYLYPTKDVATAEFRTKIEPEFLPRGEMKDHPIYGWKPEYKYKQIHAIHFNSGVSIYFKTYAQDIEHLQSGTVDAIFCDEELPFEYYSELNMRLTATKGYFHMVFTATIGQVEWEETIEKEYIGTKNERFKNAFKLQVSMYECTQYEDGSPGAFSTEDIEVIKQGLPTEAEVLRRVYGRFVVSGDLKYPSFSRKHNVKPGHHLPKEYLIYCGVDIGGGGNSHKGSVIFTGVSPDFRRGRVFKGWIGDSDMVTTAEDILNIYLELKGDMNVTASYYDWASKDFGTIAQRAGIPFIPAEKGQTIGENTLNTLFKNQMLMIYDYPELLPLVHELLSLKRGTPKEKARDDGIDGLRFCVTKIPWDWEAIRIDFQKILAARKRAEPNTKELLDRGRRAIPLNEQLEFLGDIESEIAAWNEMAGNDF